MFCVHYALPFVVAALLAGHLVALHVMGSGGPSVVPAGAVDAEAFVVFYYKDYAAAQQLRCTCRAPTYGE